LEDVAQDDRSGHDVTDTSRSIQDATHLDAVVDSGHVELERGGVGGQHDIDDNACLAGDVLAFQHCSGGFCGVGNPAPPPDQLFSGHSAASSSCDDPGLSIGSQSSIIGTIWAMGDVLLDSDNQIWGSVRAQDDMCWDDDNIITGNVFVDDDLIIGDNNTVINAGSVGTAQNLSARTQWLEGTW